MIAVVRYGLRPEGYEKELGYQITRTIGYNYDVTVFK